MTWATKSLLERYYPEPESPILLSEARNYYHLQPPPSEQDFEAVGKLLGFPLPEDLRQHYLRFNGGQPVRNLFPKDGERFPSYLIPIAFDPGGDLFCYSVKAGEFGPSAAISPTITMIQAVQ